MAQKFSDFIASLPAANQQRIKARTAALLRTISLAELRRARQFSQDMLAEAMGASQSSVSKLERRIDLYVSTLREYVEALGDVLEIRARFPNGKSPLPKEGRKFFDVS